MYQVFGVRNFQISLIAIILTLNFCHGHYLHMSVPEKHLCGAELADVLMALCNGKLNPMLQKKSVNEDYLNENTSEDIGGVARNRLAESEFLSKLAGGGIFSRVRRSWLSITEDCCRQPCSVGTLRAYCI